MEITNVSIFNLELLEEFVNNLGNSKITFRYYNNRSLNVISDHLATIILTVDQTPTAYGHLDKQDETIWLGLAVIDVAIGKGYGKTILKKLIEIGKEMKIESISLSVDKSNYNAIELYKKFNFKLYSQMDTYNIYTLDIAGL